MPAHFQPLCAPTAFQSHICVGCRSSGGCAHYQPEGAPPTPCCRRGRPGGWSEALCVLRGAPGQASIVAEVRISFSHGFRASCRCLGPHKGDPAPRPGANSPPAAAGTMLVLRRAPSKVVDFFNSTELRHVLSESDVPMAMGAEGQTRTWRLSRKAEAEGRSWCR